MTLKDLRTSAGKTVKETAAVLGIAVSSYYNYEQGIRTLNISQVLLLAKFYDCSEKEVIEAALNSQSDR